MKKVFCFYALFFLAGSLAWAEVRVTGHHRIEKETILSYLPFSDGKNVNDEAINKALRVLFETGFFKDVEIEKKNGIVYVHVKENPIINKIAFEGNKKLKDDVILKEIKIRPSEVLSSSRVQEIQQYILEIYRRLGRFEARVDPKIIELSDNRVNLVFEISEGKASYIKQINFIGNKHIKSKKLQEQILTKISRWYRFFAVDDMFDKSRVESDIDAIEKYYANNGFPHARVISSIAELNAQKTGFILTFSIDEGEKFTFGDFDIQSEITSLPKKEFEKLITFKKGDLFQLGLIEATTQAMTAVAGNKGFAFAVADFTLAAKEKGMNVKFILKEGPRVYIERIVITGNDRTHDHVIRRALGIFERDIFSAQKIKLAEERLRKLDYFKSISVEPQQGTNADQAILVVKVEEQSTGEFSLAGGYSTLDGFLSNIRVVERNFRGKGQTVSLDLGLAKKRQDISLGLFEPYFLERPLGAGVNVYSTRSSRFDSYNVIVKGFDLSLVYSLGGAWTQSWGYGFNHTTMNKVAEKVSEIIRDQSRKSTLKSSLSHVISYDMRRGGSEPTAGYIVSFSNVFSGLGGDVSYLNNTLDGSVFFPLAEEVTLNMRGSVGRILRVNKTIRVSDSYQFGYDSFRGFEYGGLGPRDVKTEDSLGGTHYYTATTELVFPVGLPTEFGVKGAAFLDTGAVWKPGQKTVLKNNVKQTVQIHDSRSLRAAVGFGISFHSPLGPIRIDYALPIRKKKFDQTRRLIIGFSTRF